MTRHLSAGLAMLFLAAAPAAPHHSFAAEFDASKPFKLTGVVTKVEWQNPHTWFYIDVVDEKSDKVTNWAMEMGSPNALMRAGWKRTSLNAGDVVTVDGYKAWEKKNTGNARSVILSKTGQKLFAASSAGQ